MKIRIPFYSGLGILLTVLLSGFVLWFVHGKMALERGWDPPRIRFVPLQEGMKFPLGAGKYYATQPVEAPEPRETRGMTLDEAREQYLQKGGRRVEETPAPSPTPLHRQSLVPTD